MIVLTEILESSHYELKFDYRRLNYYLLRVRFAEVKIKFEFKFKYGNWI